MLKEVAFFRASGTLSLQLPVLLPCVEAGASLAYGLAELVVPQDTGMGIVFPQSAQQIHQGAFLGIGACVGRMSVFIKTALVADAEALVVPAGGVGADLVVGRQTWLVSGSQPTS